MTWLYTEPATAICVMGFLYLRDDEGDFPQPFRTYPSATEPVRVTFIQKPDGMADGIPICWWAPDEIVNLPEPELDTYCIVSKMLTQACPERKDLIFPGTVVRDADGHIVGYVDFSRV